MNLDATITSIQTLSLHQRPNFGISRTVVARLIMAPTPLVTKEQAESSKGDPSRIWSKPILAMYEASETSSTVVITLQTSHNT